MQRSTKWALAVALVITLLIGSVALTLVAIAKSQAALVTASQTHSAVLNGIAKILNLKGSSVKAIVNGQNEIIGYLVTNNKDAEAICSSLPTCHLP